MPLLQLASLQGMLSYVPLCTPIHMTALGWVTRCGMSSWHAAPPGIIDDGTSPASLTSNQHFFWQLTEKDEEILQYLEDISAAPLTPYSPPSASKEDGAEDAASQEKKQRVRQGPPAGPPHACHDADHPQ